MPFDTGPLWIALGRSLLPECCWQGDAGRAVVALTYDDGPDRVRTPRVLDVLDRFDAPATFFWQGDRLDGAAGVVDRIGRSRHAIGLHGLRHRSPLWRRAGRLVEGLDRLRIDIAARTGRPADTLRWYRPPYGHLRPDQLRVLTAASYRVVMASLLPGDWVAWPHVVVRRVLDQVYGGSIIALHDGGLAGRNSEELAEMLIPRLRDKGLEFVTVPELLSQSPSLANK